MTHWVLIPVVLPLLAGAALLLAGSAPMFWHRLVSLAATATLVAVGTLLVVGAGEGAITVHAVGSWPAPFGITLVVDRLAAVMVLLTAVVALPSLLYATAGEDAEGRHFHALFQFQLLGLNGAFLTGDLFNLFVFFEILLIASYALLVHGHGIERMRASIHVVALNLVGSAVFLIAVGALYSVTGTLNLAHLARVVPTLTADDAPIARAGALLLVVVFALKSALLPLSFWLPQSYGAAAASVAALFAVMTKVGAYAILRIGSLMFGPGSGRLADLADPWLLPAALATFAFGIAGVLAASTLRALTAWLVVVSMGMLLAAVGLFSESGFAAAVYYMVHSTLVTAAFFLIADLIRRQRPAFGDRLDAGESVRQPALLAALFFVAATSVAGLPPFSGFIGKVLVLRAAWSDEAAVAVWSIILGGSVLLVLALARAASALFWKTGAGAPASSTATDRRRVLATIVPLVAGVLLVCFGAPATDYVAATAHQLMRPEGYARAVLDEPPGSSQHVRPPQ